MNLQAFFKKNLIHIGVLAFMLILVLIYFKPQLEGYALKQHDIEQWKGASHELDAYREKTGEEALWTNSMFGGMPGEQISVMYKGNWIKTAVNEVFFKNFPLPMGAILLHLISFYIMAMFLRINPIVGLIGAIAFSFASYEMQILTAGHNTKADAVAILPALLGAFIYAYRGRKWWGIGLAGLFMAIELSMNHLQVTYYFGFVLLFVGIFFLYESITHKRLKDFAITSVGIIGVFALAFVINSGNILLTADYAKGTIRGGNDVTIGVNGETATNQSAGLDREYITNWSYGKGETFNLMSPYVKGVGSMALGDSPFRENIENSDLTPQQINSVLRNSAYWGDQPVTSGPTYIGIITVFLAFMGLVFLRDKIKWPLFAVTVLVIMLSWGKNFMGLTNFFIDNIPGYNKFRAVTIILIIAELTVPVLAVLFLDQLLKNRERIVEKKKQFLIAAGSFVLFLLILSGVGLGDNYAGAAEKEQMANLPAQFEKEIAAMDPVTAKTNYGLDVTQPAQVKQFAQQQADGYLADYDAVKEARADIFTSSMIRSIVFTILAAGLLLLFVFTTAPVMGTVVAIGLLLLTMIDMIPVASIYLGSQEEGESYKYWEEKGLGMYPVAANEGDEMILQNEIRQNPSLAALVQKAENEGAAKADELEYSGQAKTNIINAYRFSALNFATNYRVFDRQGNFSSTRASYFHKSVGGYHGAKLRNINNLIEFHLGNMNAKVYNMLNVKYYLQQLQDGTFAASPDTNALGNAWFVKRVEEYASPNEEIRALGNKFLLKNTGKGTLLVNGIQKNEAEVFGAEKLQYFIAGKDTMTVPLSNGLKEGDEAVFVMDINGATNLVPAFVMEQDSAKLSFVPMTSIKVANEFNPKDEAVMLKSVASTLPSKTFTAEGTIKLTSYAPNKLTYDAKVKGSQLAVFSEIYYQNGWKAFVDNKEVEIKKVNYLLRGLYLTDGNHKIEFVYDLPKFHKANTYAMIGSIVLLLSLGGLIFISVRRRKTETN